MSKYKKLWNYIVSTNKSELNLSFSLIEEILGFSIDHSFLKYKKELESYGYLVSKILLKEKSVLIKKI